MFEIIQKLAPRHLPAYIVLMPL